MPPSVSARELPAKRSSVSISQNNPIIMLIEDRSKAPGFVSGHHGRRCTGQEGPSTKSSLEKNRATIMVASNDSLINNSHVIGVPTPPYRIRHVRKRSGTNRSNETSGANSLRQTPNLSNCETVKKTTFLNES